MQYRSEGGVADFIPDICADFFSDINGEKNSKSRSTETKDNSKVKVVVFLVHRIQQILQTSIRASLWRRQVLRPLDGYSSGYSHDNRDVKQPS